MNTSFQDHSFEVEEQSVVHHQENKQNEGKQIKNIKKSDSPIFGSHLGPNRKSSFNPQDDELQKLQKKLVEAQRQLQQNQDAQKHQMQQLDTVSMMTKYQLIFIKIESNLFKFKQVYNQRKQKQLFWALSKLKISDQEKQFNVKLKSLMIFKNIENKIKRFVFVVNQLKKNQIMKAFTELINVRNSAQTQFKQKIQKIQDDHLKQMSDKEAQIQLLKQNNEVQQKNLKIIQQQSEETQQKNQEQLRHIQVLEYQLKQAKQPQVKQVDAKSHFDLTINELEKENSELKQRQLMTEENVCAFIKEMTEMLDNQDIQNIIPNMDNDINQKQFNFHSAKSRPQNSHLMESSSSGNLNLTKKLGLQNKIRSSNKNLI